MMLTYKQFIAVFPGENLWGTKNVTSVGCNTYQTPVGIIKYKKKSAV